MEDYYIAIGVLGVVALIAAYGYTNQKKQTALCQTSNATCDGNLQHCKSSLKAMQPTTCKLFLTDYINYADGSASFLFSTQGIPLDLIKNAISGALEIDLARLDVFTPDELMNILVGVKFSKCGARRAWALDRQNASTKVDLDNLVATFPDARMPSTMQSLATALNVTQPHLALLPKENILWMSICVPMP
jgi:hypothetical protein